MRKLNIADSFLEKQGIMMPVISFDIKYKTPVGYDEPIFIQASINEVPKLKIKVDFTITNTKNKKICDAHSTIVFVKSDTRKPIRAPKWLESIFENALNLNMICN